MLRHRVSLHAAHGCTMFSRLYHAGLVKQLASACLSLACSVTAMTRPPSMLMIGRRPCAGELDDAEGRDAEAAELGGEGPHVGSAGHSSTHRR